MLSISTSVVTRALEESGVRLRPNKTPWIQTILVYSRTRRRRIELLQECPVIIHEIVIDGELSYLLGWMLGDGHFGARQAVAIMAARERAIIEPRIRPVLERFGSVNSTWRNNALLLHTSSRIVPRILCRHDGSRIWRNIDKVLESPRFAATLIAGLWDADGGAYVERSGAIRVHLYNSNLELLRRVAEALERHYGVTTALYRRRESDSSKIVQNSDRYDLYVLAKGRDSWFENIGQKMMLPWKRIPM
jgi:hypothetical protein